MSDSKMDYDERVLKEFRLRIADTFPLTPATKVRIADAVAMERWGHLPEDWPGEAWTTWQDIPFELLSKSYAVLIWFDGPDRAYFFPAFLSRFLEEVEQGSRTDFSSIVGDFFGMLERWIRHDFNGLGLTPVQMVLMRDVFEFGKQFQGIRYCID